MTLKWLVNCWHSFSADPNLAARCQDPPLGITVRQRQRHIAAHLVEHRANVDARRFARPPAGRGPMWGGAAVAELAAVGWWSSCLALVEEQEL